MLAKTPASKKAKGRVLQNRVRDILIEAFMLNENDVKSAVMGELGIDVKLSAAAREVFGWAIECKNQERMNIWECIAQAEMNAKKEGMPAMLIFKRNHSDIYVVTQLKDMIKALKK